MKKLNLIGKNFGNWTVIERDYKIDKKRTYWICKCSCGAERSVAGTSLTKGISTSCGCAGGKRQLPINPNDYLGNKYGRLTVVSLVDSIIEEGKYRTAYLCRCDCGNELIIKRHSLQSTRGPRSCGCLLAEQRTNLGLKKRKFEPHIATARMIFQYRYSDGDLSFDDFYQLSQQCCYYCGCDPSTSYNKFVHRDGSKVSQYAIDNGKFTYNGLDRIDSNFTHNKNNVVPCCAMCNRAKMDHSQNELAQWICKVYDYWAQKFNK